MTASSSAASLTSTRWMPRVREGQVPEGRSWVGGGAEYAPVRAHTGLEVPSACKQYPLLHMMITAEPFHQLLLLLLVVGGGA